MDVAAFHLKRDNERGLTVRPEPVEGWTIKPVMVRQAHHERLNLKLSRFKWEADVANVARRYNVSCTTL